MFYEAVGLVAAIAAGGYYAVTIFTEIAQREVTESELLRELHDKVQTLDVEQRAIEDSVKSLSADIYK